MEPHLLVDDMTVGRISWLNQGGIGLSCSCSLLSITLSPCSPAHRILRHLGDILSSGSMAIGSKIGIWGGEALVRPGVFLTHNVAFPERYIGGDGYKADN